MTTPSGGSCASCHLRTSTRWTRRLRSSYSSATGPRPFTGLKQRGHEETPDTPVVAVVVVEKQPVVAISTGQRHVRRDGIGIDVYHVVASRVASDLIGAQMMGVLRSTAFGLDPRRDRLAVVPA